MKTVVVERYTLTLYQDVKIGKATKFEITSRTTAGFHPKLFTSNVPEPGLFFISNLKVGDTDIFVGDGEEDLFGYNATGWGREVDMPFATAGTAFIVTGRYTGKKPSWSRKWWQAWRWFEKSLPLRLACNFRGPAV